ncbi:uncharacterized protein BCR38DRAFT_485787 [Pseudomassariella vexata]|uniref:Essential protein Yae1 N-terminal domain-containing protein n=1 Tax=Pseudomassariella vexata TaxID=1141098 RepID=A0A1Y2DV56_9PEZI|nr:uncharacterized protein BCR38DRAFT_485787 [Pseudomassariella vexata]ORY63016.1 hypothetical protein BCR38DRAFT_485787 [Pseudomassariella vexata]
MAEDPFDDVLNLEDQFYDQGYKQGYEDGTQAGKIEGRSVGLKKGFEKFLEAGRLQGKAVVWANRLPRSKTQVAEAAQTSPNKSSTQDQKGGDVRESQLPPLSCNQRLEKNVTSLYALVEPGTLSTENNDESVNDFDDRFKRAQGKLKIVERIVREGFEKEGSNDAPGNSPRPARNEI